MITIPSRLLVAFWIAAAILCASTVALALGGCASKSPASAPAVSTAALSVHLTDAQQGVTAAQAALSPNDGKATVITQWLNQH